MPISGKKVVKLLLERGWSVKSQRGSHVKLTKDGKAPKSRFTEIAT